MDSIVVLVERAEIKKARTKYIQYSSCISLQPWIAVSASGSIRNVKAVSITALRILLFRESPAQAGILPVN